jgi:hypothetical protein
MASRSIRPLVRGRLLAVLTVGALLLLAVGPPVGAVAPVAAADETPPSPTADPCMQVPSVPERHHGDSVATFGTLEDVNADGKNLKVVQQQFDLTPGTGPKDRIDKAEHALPVGYPGNHLQVKVDDDTVVCVGGEVSSMSGLEALEGGIVLVAGTIDGASLKAIFVSDLAAASSDLPVLSDRAGTDTAVVPPFRHEDRGLLPQQVATAVRSAVSEISMCLGQDMDYDAEAYVREFQGCFGGPSGSDTVGIWVPFFCPFIGCFMLDTFSYTAGLAGWGFAFPFEFAASGTTPLYGKNELTYHVPGTLTTKITPKPATEGEFTFSGGIGLNIGLNVDFCSFWGCSDLGTFNINAYSMIHQATEAGPLTGEIMEVKEVACPNILSVGIEDVPFFNFFAIKACEDMTFTGQPFYSLVTATAASVIGSQTYGYGPLPKEMTVTPDGIAVGVTYDDLAWNPLVDLGMYFRLSVLTGAWSHDIPGRIPFGSATFPAICDPFPSCGTLMSLATDPTSPIDDIAYLYQPTSVAFDLSVAPAPTDLDIISSATIAEGQPIRAKLCEDYSKAPVVGETVTFTAGSRTASDTTDANGVAEVVFPVGEYSVTASFAGTSYFDPATDSMSPVYVYRPTNFVAWGGNAGGFPVGGTFTFWGSQWSKQVTGGSYAGGSSFKGWAESVSFADGTWTSPPATSTPKAPAAVPAYIGVVVTTDVRLKGSRAYGNIADLVVLKVDDPTSYGLGPGHTATGLLKAPIR